jgi:DNA-binding transcriptional ArsR family regulator
VRFILCNEREWLPPASRRSRMSNQPNPGGEIRPSEIVEISSTAFLLADPVRAVMLSALLEGRALTAGELASSARVTAQTASSHLAKLLEGGLLTVEATGRHRYYRLAGPQVARAMEYLATIRPRSAPQRALSPETQRLRFCRRCYDHLAGEVGVALTRGLEIRNYLQPGAEKQFLVTPGGADWFRELGVDVHTIKPSRRGLAPQCMDWTERQHHVSGPLGTALMRALCACGWLRPICHTRAMELLPKGQQELRTQLGVDLGDLH